MRNEQISKFVQRMYLFVSKIINDSRSMINAVEEKKGDIRIID